jgi:LAGLIDADG endonuclease
VWVGVDSELDGGFAAGLIAGDGHFAILPNNGGTTWQCFLSVRLRADDTPLLADLCRWSGAEKLVAVPARRTSQPQTNWIVQRQADCQRLVSILDRYRLLGKKQGQYAIWRTAIAAWTGMRGDRQRVVAACSKQLRAHRHFDVVAGPSEVSITDDQLCAFLAGFVTAEAHFGATSEGHPHFRINLRRDDGELLHLFRDRLGLGYLAEVPAYRTSKAALSWRVTRLDEVRALTQLLDRYPPRGRVLAVYEAWRDLVLLKERRSGQRRLLAARVKEGRAYRPGLEWIETVDAGQSRRQGQIAVLQAWATRTDGPRTVTAYDAWRRSSSPDALTCNTIASAFGSWTKALEAAGLSAQGCRAAALNAKAQAEASAWRAARRAEQRAAILAALRDCIQMLGRQPGVTEFMAWRSRPRSRRAFADDGLPRIP